MLDGAIVVGVALAAAWIGFAIGRARAAHHAGLDGLAVSAERQRALERSARDLAHAEARLRGACEAVDVAVLLLDASLDVVQANPTAQSWFAVAPSERPSLMAAIRSAELRAVVDDARRGNLESQPVRIAERLFAVRAVPIEDGELVLALADKTALEYLERARRDLVANVSHDLRTPLTTLTLLIDALREGPADAQGGAALLADMDHQVGRIRDLADDLVQLNQLESGRALFRLVPIAVGDLLATARASVASLMAEADVTVKIVAEPGLLVLADEGHIVRAIVNLLDNARRFSPAGAKVTVTANIVEGVGDDGSQNSGRDGGQDGGQDVMICVSDEGPGIPPRERQRIFERFYRGDRARRGSGTGLGLAIAKHIVEGHGGRIWATDAAGGGAAVCLTLLAAGTGAVPFPAPDDTGRREHPRQESNLRPAD